MTGLTVVIILAAVMGVMKTAIYWLSMQWWKQTIGRYLMYQSVGYGLILLFVSFIRLHLIPASVNTLIGVALAIYALLASIEVFGVYVFWKMWRLKRLEASEFARHRKTGSHPSRRSTDPDSDSGEDSPLP